MKLKVLIVSLLLLVVSPVIYFVNRQISNIPYNSRKTPTNTPVVEDKEPTKYVVFQYNQEDLKRKNELIKTNNIDNIMVAIKTGHVPDHEILDDLSFSRINIKSFRINLDKDSWYKSLSKYFNIAEFPSSENATLNNDTWKGFSYTEASDMYTKDGYACILFRPNRFGVTPYISCSNVLDLSKNTQPIVSAFMTTLFSQAGIDCKTSKCVFTETQEEYPLHKYSRRLVGFDKNISRDNDNELIKEVNTEAEASMKFLQSSGWEANLEQYTETERKWNKSVLVSITINAKNDIFTCKHNITIADFGKKNKRNIIECSYKDSVLEEVQKFYNPYM